MLCDIAVVANRKDLHLWNMPPKYIVSQSIPSGFGFYLCGEDGVSRSEGEDCDDINSWAQDSTSYYHKRLFYRRMFRHNVVGLGMAISVWLTCRLFGNRKRN